MKPSDGALVLFTSGTTGFPKGALISHGALTHGVAISTFMGALQDLRYEDEVGETLSEERRSMVSPAPILGPLFHLGGVMPVFRSMSSGATVYIMSKWNVEIAFDMIERVGVSRLGFVPTMLWDMLRSPKAGPENMGSSALSIERIGIAQSGAGGGNSRQDAEMPAGKHVWPVGNDRVGLLDQRQGIFRSSRVLRLGCAHRQCAHACAMMDRKPISASRANSGSAGPALMSEYVGDPAATAATLQDGWCATGDIAMVDQNGLFSIVDRKKNMVISGGENIYCAEVERVLTEHAEVLEAMAFGKPDARLGERLVALVVRRARGRRLPKKR